MSPDFDFFSLFAQGLSNVEVMVAVIGIISAAAFGVLLATRFGNWILPQPRESRVSDFLPFARLMEDGVTIRCSNGSYARGKIDTSGLYIGTYATINEMMKAHTPNIVPP